MISRFCRTDSPIIPFSGEQTVDSLVCVHDLLIAGVNIQVVCQHEVAVAADPLNSLGINASLVKHAEVTVPEDVRRGSVEVYRLLDILEHSREDHLRQRLFAAENVALNAMRFKKFLQLGVQGDRPNTVAGFRSGNDGLVR